MVIDHEKLERFVTDIFAAQGAPVDEAAVVAKELVDCNLAGVDSHGVGRVMMYTDHIQNGILKIGAPVTILKETPTTAVVDFGGNFGHFGAYKMVEIVAKKAGESGMACAVSRRAYHVGRVGAYTEMLARRGYLALGMASVSSVYAIVAPWGGREGRLSTNPITYAAPTHGEPVVMDVATSAVAMGKSLLTWQKGEEMPPDALQDNEGRPTTDPRWGLTGLVSEDLYPHGGTYLPMGGKVAGHKGYGLSTMTEAFCAVLASQERTPAEDQPDYLNVLYLQAIDLDFLYGLDDYKARMEQFVQYLKNTPPAAGFTEVLVPGELEMRMRAKRKVEGIPLPEKIWGDLVKIGGKYGVFPEI